MIDLSIFTNSRPFHIRNIMTMMDAKTYFSLKGERSFYSVYIVKTFMTLLVSSLFTTQETDQADW